MIGVALSISTTKICMHHAYDDWNQTLMPFMCDYEHFVMYRSRKWGDCVARMLMEKTTGGSMPMYGRIIFKTEAVVQLVLNGERLIKISIDQRQIWLRKYVPKPTNAADSSIRP